MPGKRVTATKWEQYDSLRSLGLTQAEACRKTGIPPPTASRHDHQLSGGVRSVKAKLQAEHNPPKAFSDLSDVGKRALESFELFGQVFFALRVPAWWRITAEALVSDVMSPEETQRLVHAASGSGKTTMLETLVLWLISGGGSLDPAYGRSLRVMFAGPTLAKAIRSVDRLRRIVDDPRPFYDFKQRRGAEHSLLEVFGRYRPSPSEGDDESAWRQDSFTVAQLAEHGLFAKDPTLVAYSIGASPLSSRLDLAIVDDPALMRTIGDEDLVEKFRAEFESRVEPEGALFVVGQRLHAADLYGSLGSQTWTDDDGVDHPAYATISFPAHRDDACNGQHVEWDGTDACLLDAVRLPWTKLLKEQAKPTYGAVYQQDPQATSDLGIADRSWIFGGVDSFGVEAIGCVDRDRAFWESALVSGRPATYVSVDLAEGGKQSNSSWTAIELWTLDVETKVRYLLYGVRGRWTTSELLRHEESVSILGGPTTGRSDHGGFSGVLEDVVRQSASIGSRVSALVIEANSARGLIDHEDFQEWLRSRWTDLTLITPTTGVNRNDPVSGVNALLANSYRNGTARWPYQAGGSVDALDYLKVKARELTHPRPHTQDTVMSEWIGAISMDEIILAGSRSVTRPTLPDKDLPPYLRRQRYEGAIDRNGRESPTPEAKERGLEQLPFDHPARQHESYMPTAGLS